MNRERIIEVLCSHFVIDGVDGLGDNYNATVHTVTAEMLNEVADDLLALPTD